MKKKTLIDTCFEIIIEILCQLYKVIIFLNFRKQDFFPGIHAATDVTTDITAISLFFS